MVTNRIDVFIDSIYDTGHRFLCFAVGGEAGSRWGKTSLSFSQENLTRGNRAEAGREDSPGISPVETRSLLSLFFSC
jgi:hypothetical protein